MAMLKWTMPSHYMGATWPDYYVFIGQNRDSDALSRSNFRVALKRLGGESGNRTGDMFASGTENPLVTVVRETHWACGWVEWIAIHESAVEAVAAAHEMLADMEGYPVLDESDWSELEDEECEQTWRECYDASERLDYFRRHGYTCSDISDLFKAIRGGQWYYAASMLHSPSDLLY